LHGGEQMTDLKDGEKPYVFGYIQGCSMIALAFFLGIPAVDRDQLNVGMLGYAVLWFLSGVGIVTRWTVYGLVAFYITLIISVQALFVSGPAKFGWWMLLGVVVWFGVPAALYYPRRYLDFVYHDKPRLWERKQSEPAELKYLPTDYVKPYRDLSEEDRAAVVEHLRRGFPKEK
jgi:hypothetical protein